MLSLTERIISEYCIIASYRNDTTRKNPFTANLLETIEKCESSYERKFLYHTFIKGNEDVPLQLWTSR